MAAIDGLKGYAVVSWLNDYPEELDITGKGSDMDVPFESVSEAETYILGAGFNPSISDATAIVVALVEVKVIQ
jgi:hypothetical protein